MGGHAKVVDEATAADMVLILPNKLHHRGVRRAHTVAVLSYKLRDCEYNTGCFYNEKNASTTHEHARDRGTETP